MFSKKSSPRQDIRPDSYMPKPENLPDVALAAIMPYRRQKDVTDFANYVLDALERNTHWLNTLIEKQNCFRCALMTGSGPNRFQIRQIIYPQPETESRLEIECRDSEDYDKVAIAALLKLSSADVDRIIKYTKTRFFENSLMKEELSKGKLLGFSYALLRPLYENHYRITERFLTSNSAPCSSTPKRRLIDRPITRSPKKAKQVN
ncbi:uncharacterized protein [Battus philenor]|uniref:uncharacterized protein n=1 Tax=Battus philenor TaxID=42288 RepID=UPI0035D05C72